MQELIKSDPSFPNIWLQLSQLQVEGSRYYNGSMSRKDEKIVGIENSILMLYDRHMSLYSDWSLYNAYHQDQPL